MIDPWLVCRRRIPAADLRLFCFPYAGGGASIYRHWCEDLRGHVEVYAVQFPGRENRIAEPSLPSLSRLIEELRGVLSPLTTSPFAFFGHSLGALVGFELARELRRSGLPTPVCLFASGREGPRVPDPDPPMYRLPESEFIAELGRRYKGIPAEILEEPELVELLLPTLRADLAMTETYAYAEEEPLDCPIFVFGGRDDHKIGRDELEAWRPETRGDFSVRVFPGDHFFLETERRLVLEAVSEYLAQTPAWTD